MIYNIDLINNKLKNFSRKFYFNKFLSGVIVFFLFLIVITSIFLLLEYLLYFNVNVKIFVITAYLILILISFIFLIIIPLLKYFNVINGLSKKKLNYLIVNAFPEIKDKLLNIFELSKASTNNLYSEELIIASIDQKIQDVRIFNFNDAVSFKENIKFLYILLLTISFTTLLFYLNPKFYQETSFRIFNYQKTFHKPLPYDLTILNNSLSIGKGEDFTLQLTIKGIKEQETVSILMAGKSYLIKNDSTEFFSYKFNNVNNDIFFQVTINKFSSQLFKITILDKPVLNNFTAFLNKPGYTSLKNEEIKNLTEITIPSGTVIDFSFTAYNTDSLFFINNSSSVSLDKSRKNEFNFKKQFIDDQTITIDLKNSNFYLPEYLKLNIRTIRDEFPAINLKTTTDSLAFTKIFFRGKINDDYGFSKLAFMIKINEQIDTIIDLNILKNLNDQEFFYAFDFSAYRSIDENINYYFEVFDNDVVGGPKSAISEIFIFNFPSSNEINDYQDIQFEEIENIFKNSMNLADRLKENLVDLKKKMLNAELSEWERKEIEKNITTNKNNLEKEIENIKEKNDQLNNYLKSFTEQDQNLIDKQKQIQELLDDVFSDDLKKLLDEFNKMMKELNKENINNSREKLDISLDDLSKQLDRNLEMLKKMKVEQKLEMLSKSLDEIVKKQEENLSDIDEKLTKDKLLNDQNKQKNDLNSIEKEYNDLKDLNNELEEPMNLFDFNNEMNEIKKEFANSISNIDKNNKKKGKESLQKNSENLKNLQFNLNQMIDNLFKQQNMENLADLLQILDNLVTFSFNQEKVIVSTQTKNFNTVTFVEQKKLVNDFIMIKDSLYALAKREPSLNTQINKEIVSIQNYFLTIQDNFESSSLPSVSINQQKVLTSVNNLSLFLSEVIKKLQESEANSQPGNQNCNKPGNKPNPNSMSNSMKSMQQSLQQQLEKIMQMMKEGGQGKGIQNEMGKAISQQEAMHDLLQKMMNQGNVGSGAYETLKQADQLLNKVREDILRNNISNNTIDRQKQILTRLLEADKSENEREFDEKRKSNSALEQFSSKTNTKIENSDFEINFEEKLIKNKLILNSFYQQKFQNFLFVLDSINGEDYKNRIIGK
jgi:hypothetical protein